MKTRLQNHNFTIFKIALNRVLTLPADRARCTDHFAGSGSKIEDKNRSVVAKHWKYRISVPMSYITSAYFNKGSPSVPKHGIKARQRRAIQKKNTQTSKLSKFGLRLNFENYNSSFAPASRKIIKRLNQRRKRKIRDLSTSLIYLWERAGAGRPGLSLSK